MPSHSTHRVPSMSRSAALLTLLLFGGLMMPGDAGAQDQAFELTTLVTPGAVYSDVDGFDVDFGIGVGFAWSFRPTWGLDSRISFDDGTGINRTKYDLGLRRSLNQWEDWRTHLSFGVHHRETETGLRCGPPTIFCRPTPRDEEDATGAFVGFDADWSFARSTALRLDSRYSVFDSDDSLDLSVGLAFRF